MAKAYAMYQKAANLGSAEAWYRMGLIARKRVLNGLDPKRTLGFFKRAAEGGFEEACTALARAYMEGIIARAHEGRADYWLEKALATGNIEAYFLKGVRLAGLGDTSGALDWLTRAAREGSVEAQYTIGRMLRDGKLGDADITLAENWLRLASENGSIDAKYDLARVLLKNAQIEGRSLSPAQTQEIVNLLTAAAEGGNASAAFRLSRVVMKSGERDLESLRIVRDYAERAFDMGKSDAAFTMALTYACQKNGDMDAALTWLEMGAADKDLRSRYAQQLIARGVDTKEAIRTTASMSNEQIMQDFEGKNPVPEHITPPKIISMEPPKFPSEFAGLSMDGYATVVFVVSPEGSPQEVQIIRNTHTEFADAVLKAVEGWKFEPALKNGEYARIPMRISFKFKNSPR